MRERIAKKRRVLLRVVLRVVLRRQHRILQLKFKVSLLQMRLRILQFFRILQLKFKRVKCGFHHPVRLKIQKLILRRTSTSMGWLEPELAG